MRRRHLALPSLWLLTDERQGEALWPAIRRLPRGAGVIVRHYSLPLADRIALARCIARTRPIAFSGTDAQARAAGAIARYGHAKHPGRLPLLATVHNRRELKAAERAHAAQLFASPVFPTRTHPGARALGPSRLGLLVQGTRTPIIALGGMTGTNFRRVRALAGGWAAIDAWTILSSARP